MLAELIDFTGPAFQPGREVSPFAIPIPIEGPSTLQLALAAAVTLGVYAIFHRGKRPALKQGAQSTAKHTQTARPSREAA